MSNQRPPQRQPAIIPSITRYTHIYSPHTYIADSIMGMKEIGIFPASGALGGSTYRHLLKLVPNDHVTLINRYPEKVEAQYRDAGVRVRKASYESSLQELELAFSGLDVLFLVSYPSHVHEYRVKVSWLGSHSPKGCVSISNGILLTLLPRCNSQHLMPPSALE